MADEYRERTEPMFYGFILNEKVEDEGRASIAFDFGQEIIDVFFETAVYCRVKISERSVFKSGEIFYYNNQIQEFRLTLLTRDELSPLTNTKTICVTKTKPGSQFSEIKDTAKVTDFFNDLEGNFFEAKKKKKEIIQEKISASAPKMNYKRLIAAVPNVIDANPENIKYVSTITTELRVAPADRSRKYLAVRVDGDQLYFCWDVPPVENTLNKPGAQAFALKSLYPILGFIKIFLSDLPNILAISLNKLLSVHEPKRAFFKNELKQGDAETRINYYYESTAIMQWLIKAYQEIIDISPEGAIERIAKKNNCSFQRATHVFFLEIIWARDEFVNQTLLIDYEKFAAKLLEFTSSALTELYAKNQALRFSPHWTINVKERDAEINNLGAQIQKRVNELFLFKPGRRSGSTNLFSLEKEAAEKEMLASQIRNAVKSVCEDQIKKFGKFEIESKVTRQAVAARLKTSRKSLSSWIKHCELDFEFERDKALRGCLGD